jgi:hypothetical protein
VWRCDFGVDVGGRRLEVRESWAGSPAVAACTGVKQQGVCGVLPKVTPLAGETPTFSAKNSSNLSEG